MKLKTYQLDFSKRKESDTVLIFYDFEVFKDDWLVVFINAGNHEETVIANDRDSLYEFYKNHKTDIFVGYNSRHYDQYIFKGILAGFDPKKINDWIIIKDRKGWEFSDGLRNYQLYNFDIKQNIDRSLKVYEGFMGSDIRETSVPFDIDRKLTAEELAETIKYCRHDVQQTMKFFLYRQEDFNSMLQLIKTFDLPLSDISKTKAQIAAKVLDCSPVERNDEWEIEILPCVELDKYASVKNWFLNPKNQCEKNAEGKKPVLNVEVAGIEHSFGWGGVHAGRECYHSKGLIVHVDVQSYYPSIMIFWDKLTRNSRHPKKYEEIYHYRLKLKAEGKKKEQAPYKIILNSTYGICNDKFSLAYDPKRAHEITMNGQLMLLDLIEHMEKSVTGFELIQSNTDGLIVKIPNTDKSWDELDDVCNEWEKRCRMGLEFHIIEEIWEKDVNNYAFRTVDGKWERKGGWLKETNPLDNELPVVTRALFDYMKDGVPLEKTIYECDELVDFQSVHKLSGKFTHFTHGSDKMSDTVVRYFASKDRADKGLTKYNRKGQAFKVAGSSENCFVWNEEISGVKCPSKLDKAFYLDMAQKRLKEFGV